MKLKTTILFVSLFLSSLYANNPYILLHDGLIDQRAQDKIAQIGAEVKSKLNVNLYVFMKENNGVDLKLPFDQRQDLMHKYNQNIIKDLKGSYAVLVVILDQMYATVLLSDDLQNIIDKNEIRDEYVTPVLASKDKNTLFTKTSAASLNGYAQMADMLAESQGLKLESSIGSGNKTFSTIWKMLMYTLVLGGIIIYAIIIMKEKKYKKQKEAQNNDA